MLDYKTVRIFAYSSTREESNKRGLRASRVRLLLILRKKPTVLQSKKLLIWLFGKFRFASRTFEVVLFSLLIG